MVNINRFTHTTPAGESSRQTLMANATAKSSVDTASMLKLMLRSNCCDAAAASARGEPVAFVPVFRLVLVTSLSESGANSAGGSSGAAAPSPYNRVTIHKYYTIQYL